MSGSDKDTALATLLLSGSNSASSIVQETVLEDIWENVVTNGASLDGKFDTTYLGACEAAHRHDWPLCAYLAAMCFCKAYKQPSSLDMPCSSWQDEAWREVVAPILVDVPLGRERLKIQFDDREEWVSTDRILDGKSGLKAKQLKQELSETELKQLKQLKEGQLNECLSEGGSVVVKGRGRGIFCHAEYFKEGSTVQPVKFKRVQLTDDAVMELRHSLKSANRSDCRPWLRDDIGNHYMLSHIPGVCWYYVLSYPFAGDLTKALLRPKADGWTQMQRKTLQRLSETLLSRCAKSARWDLVEVLLKYKVPCPDLTREFESICNHSRKALEAWRHDLDMAAHGPLSLLELAAWDPATTENKERDKKTPLKAVIEALRTPQVAHSRGRVPLICAAADRGRWNIVLDLLLTKNDNVNVCAGSLLNSWGWASAPPTVKLVAELRSEEQKIIEATRAANSWKDYFSRQFVCPLPAAPSERSSRVPHAFTIEEDGVLSKEGVRVLDCSFNLGPQQGNEHVFVKVDPGELDKAKEAKASAANSTISVLTLNLDRRKCLSDPCMHSGKSSWISLFTQADYLQKNKSGAISICTPRNQLAYAHILQQYTVRVTVVSPCCKQPLGQVPVYVGGCYVGKTEKLELSPSGELSFMLFPGKYTIASPEYAWEDVTIDVKSGQTDPVDVRLISTGRLFTYLTSFDAEHDAVRVCANRDHIDASDVACFVGKATMPSSHGLFIPPSKPNLGELRACSERMPHIKIEAEDGRQFEINEELDSTWYDQFKDECLFAVLFNGPPWRKGKLAKARPAERDPLRVARSPVTAMPFARSPTFPRPSSESNLQALGFTGNWRSSELIQPNGKPTVSKFPAPPWKRLPTPDTKPAVKVAVAQRRPKSANPSMNPSRVNGDVDRRPRSASRGRSNTELMMCGGRALSFRYLK